MRFPPLLAHGALGNWDELIFLSVAISLRDFDGRELAARSRAADDRSTATRRRKDRASRAIAPR